MHRVLIANRGEIARRVAQTCHRLGLTSVAVFSDADADLPFVREADLAVRIGPGEAAQSYLDPERILDAARRSGADAVHPGYGFLSENAAFARAVQEAGLIWIGPPPEAIEAMGDKAAARRTAAEHEVPTVPGYDASQDPDELATAAAEIGFPVLIKAVAGGGGRGMRRVDDAADFAEALASAKREAIGAFGDDVVILERYVTRPRHIEVQVFGDTHGTVLHLGERECSVQRRHQKILEEAPSPAVDDALRAQMGDAACRVAAAAGYVGAGTVEFILDPEGRFYFLEMNTRLQVEHPVTEQVTGLDLVELQLRVARGEPLPLSQDDVQLTGWSIEARVYAEDPMRDWLPATGTLHRLDLPAGDGIRVDAGYETGSVISPYYDSMIAKVIATGPDRATANARLRRALVEAWAPGVVTNLPLLRDVVSDASWEAGDLDTGFLGRVGLPKAPPLHLPHGAIAATALGAVDRDGDFGVAPAGWRLYGRATQSDRWRCGAEELQAAWTPTDDGFTLAVSVEGDDGEPAEHTVSVGAHDGDALTLEVDGVRRRWRVVRVGDLVYAHFGDGEAFLQQVPRFPVRDPLAADPGTCTATTPGTVTAVHVEVGDTVTAGQRLVTLEAMKMEHALSAPEDGVVSEVRVQVGDAVDEGALLVRIDTDDDEDDD